MQAQQVKIVSENIQQILADTIRDYEQRTGKVLQPAHIEHSIIQTYAYRELLVRKGVNTAFLNTFPQFATGLALDLCGADGLLSPTKSPCSYLITFFCSR